MGHERVGALPKTKRWRDIVQEMADYTSEESQVRSVARRTLENVRARFRKLETDPSVKAAFQFLVALSAASRLPEPQQELAALGIQVPDTFSPFATTRAAHIWVTSKNGSSEYAHLAKSAVGDTIAAWHQQKSRQLKLFYVEDNPLDIWHDAGTGAGFCELARIFFARLTERYLNYFLEREASAAITDIRKRELFQEQLKGHVDLISKHAFETSKITQSFAAGWYNNYARDRIPSEEEIERFLYVAFGKIRDELSREVEK